MGKGKFKYVGMAAFALIWVCNLFAGNNCAILIRENDAEEDTEDEIISSIMYIKGISDESSLSEEIIDEFMSLAGRKLQINYADLNDMLSCGLFSPYQCAVIEDYRKRTGDILSVGELSLLDGFGHEYASALYPFLDFIPAARIGSSSMFAPSPRGRLTVRNGNKFDPVSKYGGNAGVKASVSVPGRFDINISLSAQHGKQFPERHSFSAAYYGRKILKKLIIGDFNLRFGQGLALWSGFSMSGLHTTAGFTRNAQGAVQYSGWTGNSCKRGVAAELQIDRWKMSPFASVDGLYDMMLPRKGRIRKDKVCLMPVLGVNALRLFKRGQISFTGYTGYKVSEERIGYAKISGDIRWNIGGTEFYSECAFDICSKRPAVICGARSGIGEGCEVAGLLRYYPNDYDGKACGAVRSGSGCDDEHGVSLGFSHYIGKTVALKGRKGFGSVEKRFKGDICIDAVYSPSRHCADATLPLQIKLNIDQKFRVSPSLMIFMKLTGRFRSYGNADRYRSGLSLGTCWSDNLWSIRIRTDMSHCTSAGFMGYAECGYITDRCRIYVRATGFVIDNWNDRIYVYERDTPGGFSVPAFYGRGYRASLYSAFRLSRSTGLYLRASWTDYPFGGFLGGKKKPGKAELKIQLSFDIGKFHMNRSDNS